MNLLTFLIAVLTLLLVSGCASDPSRQDAREEAARFLEDYQQRYQTLSYQSSLAEWTSNTRIIEGDDSNAERTRAANEALARFTGSIQVVETARRLLEHRNALEPLQVKQLEAILYEAANNPEAAAELVRERIAAETAQTERLFGFTFRLEGKEVTTNELDAVLKEETALPRRLAAWESSKEVGRGLREGLVALQSLRNGTVRALGYPDYFSYQVSDYGMTTAEMLELMDRLNRELRPLYRELHTWVRHQLARRYQAPVPDVLPAHWLPNRWGQDWSSLVEVEGFNLDEVLRQKSAEWLIRQAERFYVSLGFAELPASFWELSSLYPLPPETPYKKNNHASAWHLDLAQDVRCLMSIEPNTEWFETTHHELGHIYYDLAYSQPSVPILLRRGANRAFHEAVGSLLGLAAMQPRFAAAAGVVPPESTPDPMLALLKEALNYVVFIPWSAGVMTRFEHELYAQELPAGSWNARWWELKRRYQGIEPPGVRPAGACDPATKTHINNDAAQYYDYALSYVILFQLHDHISRELLGEDPHNTNYYGRREVGDFLRRLLSSGATRDWRQLLEEVTGSPITAAPMRRYFEPLLAWLRQQNQGRTHTLPEI